MHQFKASFFSSGNKISLKTFVKILKKALKKNRKLFSQLTITAQVREGDV